MSRVRCACRSDGQRANEVGHPKPSPTTPLPTWGRFEFGPARAQHLANHLTQDTPLCFFRLTMNFACVGPPRGVASRPAIRAHFFASAARRNASNAGARATLGHARNSDSDANTVRTRTPRNEPTPTARHSHTPATRTRFFWTLLTGTPPLTGTANHPWRTRDYLIRLHHQLWITTQIVYNPRGDRGRRRRDSKGRHIENSTHLPLTDS